MSVFTNKRFSFFTKKVLLLNFQVYLPLKRLAKYNVKNAVFLSKTKAYIVKYNQTLKTVFTGKLLSKPAPLTQLVTTRVAAKGLASVRSRRVRLLKEDSLMRGVLLRWMMFWMGSPVIFLFDKSLHLRLSTSNLLALALLDFRISQYVSNGDTTKLGLWTGGPNIVLMSTMTRDPDMLISWLRLRLTRMSLFSHRRFFRLLGVLLTTLTVGNNKTLGGVNMYLVGKISVTGNAMSRSQLVKNGIGGNSNLRAQVVSGFTLVHTNTGCLGLTISYFYN